MKKTLFLTLILALWFADSLIMAQQWNHYNPTLWYDVNTVEILSPGVIVIGGGREANDSVQVMFQTADYGLTWFENPHDGYAPWNKSIAFSDLLNGYGVGYDGRIIKSGDAGRNWGYPSTPINRDFNKIIYAGAGTYYIAGGNKTRDSIQTILKSNDYGNSWNVIYDTLGPWLKSLYFSGTLKGFAVGDKGVILSTTNGGNTWLHIVAPIQRDFNAITFINADTGYIVGGSSLIPFRRTILRTINGGVSWNVLKDTTGGILTDISFADSQVGYTAGENATLLKTNDGGVNWSPIIIDTNLTGYETFNAVKFYNRNYGAIGGKSGLLYIYLNRPVEIFTLGTDQVGTTDATLLGGINTHTKNARYSFIYSNNINFASFDSTQWINVQNDSLLSVHEYIQGLTPNTTYYFFLKAITDSNTIYSDTLRFYTGVNSSFIIQTLDATNVSNWMATLNGSAGKFPEPVNLFFEYGSSPAFGSWIAATPPWLNDTLMHFAQADISGLQTNTQYFFRLKGVTASGIYYGNTKMFVAANLPVVNSGYATNVTLTTASLNGGVGNNGLPAAVKFEYGITVLYGNDASAIPDSVFGTGYVNTSCALTGLTPFTTYHFRLKCTNSTGTSYGGDMTFITGGPSVFTNPASDININSAQINGTINANNIPTVNKFEWGTTLNYGNEVTAVPDSATGNINIAVSYQLNGLSLNTYYHYRIKATNALGTVYGNNMSFMTGAQTSLLTLPATEINMSSALLNGSINTGGIPTAIKFEYGTTLTYGNEIITIPDSSSDPGSLDVYALLSGLLPNTIYHFRIKGTNNMMTNYGNDMLFYTGYSEIPNFDFENWSPVVITKPEGWNLTFGKITQYVPACHNNVAVKIENDTSNGFWPGVMLIGFTNNQGQTFIDGAPFNARPDTMKGCFNYSIPINDTALILLKLKNQGITISENWYKIYGNSSGNFTGLKFPIAYSSGGNADSLILLMAVTDIRSDPQQGPGGGFLIVDDIRFTGTTENILNNDFENWASNVFYSLDNWWYENKNGTDPVHPQDLPVSRTNDAQRGSSAVLIQNFIYPTSLNMGWLSTSKKQQTIPNFSVNARHQTLTGYYKFLPENNDTMNIQIMMYKNHVVVGNGNFQTNAAVTNYSPFVININYSDSVVPDSGQINISSFLNRPSGKTKVYIDNLNFDGFLSEVKEPAIINAGNIDFKVYPNPFADQTTISFTIIQDENVCVRLFDLTGKQVSLPVNGNFKPGGYKINLQASGLNKGFYICVMNTGDQVLSRKVIIY